MRRFLGCRTLALSLLVAVPGAKPDKVCTTGVRFEDRGLPVLDCITGLEWEKTTTFHPAVALGVTVCASPLTVRAPMA